MAIKLVALDLDRTTLRTDGELSSETKSTLEYAIEKGVNIVIATGRVLGALPPQMLEIKGIQYALTSNGANIIDLRTGKAVYTNHIAPHAVEMVAEVLGGYDYMVEVFTDGHAYVEKYVFEHLEELGFTAEHINYVRTTREPLERIFDFMLENKGSIENININFTDMKGKYHMAEVLESLEDVTITSSFERNLEIGGATTSKGTAVGELCRMLGIEKHEVMACGDSPNDAALLMAAGLPVAVENAKDEVKKIAAYVTASNDDDGVAKAIKKFVLI